MDDKKRPGEATAYFYLTDQGMALAQRLAAVHPGDLFGKENFKDRLKKAFTEYDNLVCIMACGIVVRILAPLIDHKTKDPAVVVMDQKGDFAISLLSGHLGGANALAAQMARISGGQAVITTATDVASRLSFDCFAKDHGLAIENISSLKFISSALLSDKKVRVITDLSFPELEKARDQGLVDICPTGDAVSHTQDGPDDLPLVVIHEGLTLSPNQDRPVLYLRPRTICAGIGCKRGMDGDAIYESLLDCLKEKGLSPLSLSCLATIPLKADEPGVIQTAKKLHIPLIVIDPEDIAALDLEALNISPSDFVASQTGVLSVSTASAYLASGRGEILVDKKKYKGITVALAKRM